MVVCEFEFLNLVFNLIFVDFGLFLDGGCTV